MTALGFEPGGLAWECAVLLMLCSTRAGGSVLVTDVLNLHLALESTTEKGLLRWGSGHLASTPLSAVDRGLHLT